MANTKIPVELSSTPGIVDNSNATAITIDASENVGIGTASPNSYANLTTLTIDGTNGSVLDFESGGTLTGEIFSSSASLAISFKDDSDCIFYGNITERMRITNAGNVGIGTSSPSSELHVKAASGFSEIYFQGASSTSGSYLFDNGTESGIYKVDSGYMAFGTGNTERMRIDSGGRVMIAETSNSGYSNNADDLIVGDNGSATERGISLGSTSASAIRWNDGADAGLVEYVHSDNSMRLYTAASERMRIASNGRTSIGTTTTNAGLTVANADIRCTGAAIANDANSISMSQESPGAYITARGPSTSTRGTLHLSVNQSNGGGGRVGFKIDNLGLIYAEYMGSGGATTDVNYNTSTGEIYQVTSSQRYKENISEYTDSILEKVNNLTVKNFDYKEGGYTNQIGLIAEEVEEQIPYLVNKKEIEGYDEPQPDSVKYSQLSVFLLKAIQEQQAQIEALQSEINLLKGE